MEPAVCQTVDTDAVLINRNHIQLINVITSFKLQGLRGHTANSISNKCGRIAQVCREWVLECEKHLTRFLTCRKYQYACERVCAFLCDQVAIRRINECVHVAWIHYPVQSWQSGHGPLHKNHYQVCAYTAIRCCYRTDARVSHILSRILPHRPYLIICTYTVMQRAERDNSLPFVHIH